MNIYSMTATFGKLEHKTLTLNPGLNVIEAPNEWGKSTWCAFLVNMLYGLETRLKSTKTSLADKDRYVPWSGAPMAGRIDLCWNGRDITIERRTKGRLIFGEFLAYETETGMDVPELNASNCGALLLGVERSVFTRAGFLRLTDLPVTQDEALRRRLNNLVTTGDESGAGDTLQKELRDLKNKCRYNRSGLLPQAEAQRDQLEGQLSELESLAQQSENLRTRQKELENRIDILENHRMALRFAAAQADAQKVSQAKNAAQTADDTHKRLEEACWELPSAREAEEALQQGDDLRQQLLSLQMEENMLPPLPQAPAVPRHFEGISPEQAAASTETDLEALQVLTKQRTRKNAIVTIAYTTAGLILIALAVARLAFSWDDPAVFLVLSAAAAISTVSAAIGSILFTARWHRRVEALYDKHPAITPNQWLADANAYAQAMRSYDAALAAAKELRGDLDARKAALSSRIHDFTGGQELAGVLRRWQQVRESRDALADAARQLRLAQNHVEALQSMARTAEPPRFPDTLNHSESETDALLSSARFELRQLQLKLGQLQGRSDALGQETVLRTQLKAVKNRMIRLEDTYAALELAQKALAAATAQLQRRFAPRIAKRAQELFQKLTSGRYDRLTLSEDLSLNTSTRDESTMRTAQWRSDGTIDQLYLALRLAVAEELTPEAPLILDDALVRFDDARLAAAADILKETAQTKQVILFTCQSREQKLLEDML